MTPTGSLRRGSQYWMLDARLLDARLLDARLLDARYWMLELDAGILDY